MAVGNQGIHELDICRWGLGVTYPTRISATGGHFMFDDDQETPNTLVVTYEFNGHGNKRQLMVFEVRHWITNHEAGIGEDRRGGNTVGNGKDVMIRIQTSANKLILITVGLLMRMTLKYSRNIGFYFTIRTESSNTKAVIKCFSNILFKFF